MGSIRSILFLVGLGLLAAPCASAQTFSSDTTRLFARATSSSWRIAPPSCSDEAAPAAGSLALAVEPMLVEQDDAQPLHAAAVEHSDAYETRKRIHKLASFATLPLFATEVALGQSLFNNSTNASAKSAHGIVGAGIMGLFAVNTVTGVWNMFGEDRSDPKGRTLRLVHGLLMLAADVGFVATSMSTPKGSEGRNPLTFATTEATHRNIAVASISVGTVGYLLMLFGYH